MSPVHVLGIPGVQRLQYVRKGSFRTGNTHQVDVVGHQAVCKNLQPMLACILVQQFKIPLSVGNVEENVLSSIAALGDVMRNTSENRSRYPWHGPIIAKALQTVNRNRGAELV
jgi:hypothetical protein